ncbi:MAG: class I SAM-dependent rRNA methyltransferase [candidate division Zixibacteria bacterium]|nr:class I SAM-dependent rRNA methyltransferase [candidate division Zixibacteria bacterium]
MYPIIKIKQKRGASILSRHPWIFSGAIEKVSDDIKHGDIVYVEHDNKIVATGMFSRHSMIVVRVMAFDEVIIDKDWFRSQIRLANKRRQIVGLIDLPDLTGYRIIFGQSDLLPGLVVDKYNDVLVMQISTAGIDEHRDTIIECLVEEFSPRAIFERSDLQSRKEEKLTERVGVCHGEDVDTVEFLEYGRKYIADIKAGQKTGFYLDQRDLRSEIQNVSAGRKAVDIFSYSGAAGIAALNGGCESVEFIDSSKKALELCKQHTELNGFDIGNIQTIETDVFQWISEKKSPEYDLVLLDPPALIKSRKHIESGKKAYHFLNRACLRMITDGGILVSSSCSAYMTEDEFIIMLRKAANQAEVELQLIKTIRQSPDHPLSVYFPEAFYLKSVVCKIIR